MRNLSEELAYKILEKGKPRFAELNTQGTAINIRRAAASISQQELIDVLDWMWATGFQAAQTMEQIHGASEP